jgi:cysteine synthase
MDSSEFGFPTKLATALGAIGNTPIVKLQKIVPKGCADIFVKLEAFNPTGSKKDRMALSMVEGAERRGELLPGMTVVEYSGGSTGSSLAFICAVKGYHFHVISADPFGKEKLDTMRAFGADLEVMDSPSGQITAEVVGGMIARATELAEDGNYFFTDQLNNDDIILGFERMGDEIIEQIDGPIDAFCDSVGTAGSLLGVRGAFQKAGQNTRIVALEPASSPIMTGGRKGGHKVEGVGLGFIVPHLKGKPYDEARAIEESVARETAVRLAREEGIFAGISSGMNVAGALELAAELGPGKTVVAIAVDTGLKYLSEGLFSQ